MNSFVRKITVKFLSFALIAFMGLLVTNKTLYTHSHILENGKAYTHAHPYNKTNDSKPYKSHHHTKAEYLFYQNLELLFFFIYAIAIAAFIFKRVLFYIYNEQRYIQQIVSSNTGRAPPIS